MGVKTKHNELTESAEATKAVGVVGGVLIIFSCNSQFYVLKSDVVKSQNLFIFNGGLLTYVIYQSQGNNQIKLA